MFTATAAEMVETDLPNSARSGSMSTPGTARKAAAPTRARKVTAATHQAGWMRWARVGTLTPDSMTSGADRHEDAVCCYHQESGQPLTRCDVSLPHSGTTPTRSLVEYYVPAPPSHIRSGRNQ